MRRTKLVLTPNGRMRQPVQAPRVFKVRLDQSQARYLRKHADRRGIDVDAMFDLLIKTIFNDKLIDALIDDDGGRDPTPTATVGAGP